MQESVLNLGKTIGLVTSLVILLVFLKCNLEVLQKSLFVV